jgi:1-acyl-sn-glycerol-3-phosphate acyltransferase
VSVIRWFAIIVTALYYVLPGVPRLLFGTTGKYFKRASGPFGRNLLKRAGGKPTWSGLENLDPSKSYIFIGNHQSYADIFIMLAALESHNMRTLFMVKKELLNIPLFSLVAKHMRLIPVDREESRKALKAMIEAIKTIQTGQSITIFPEGTRTRDGNLNPFKGGAFLIAERTGMQVVPFVITGTMNIIPYGGMPVTPGPCHISFLDPISTEGMLSKELAAKVESLIAERYAHDKKIMDEKWVTIKK